MGRRFVTSLCLLQIAKRLTNDGWIGLPVEQQPGILYDVLRGCPVARQLSGITHEHFAMRPVEVQGYVVVTQLHLPSARHLAPKWKSGTRCEALATAVSRRAAARQRKPSRSTVLRQAVGSRKHGRE